MKFEPNYIITPKVINSLMRMEKVKIEGNRLDADQVKVVLQHKEHFPGRERDEYEVKGYYVALTQVEKWIAQNVKVTEKNYTMSLKIAEQKQLFICLRRHKI